MVRAILTVQGYAIFWAKKFSFFAAMSIADTGKFGHCCTNAGDTDSTFKQQWTTKRKHVTTTIFTALLPLKYIKGCKNKYYANSQSCTCHQHHSFFWLFVHIFSVACYKWLKAMKLLYKLHRNYGITKESLSFWNY